MITRGTLVFKKIRTVVVEAENVAKRSLRFFYRNWYSYWFLRFTVFYDEFKRERDLLRI